MHMQITVLPWVILCSFFRRLMSLGFPAGVAGLAPGWSLIVQGQQGLTRMGTCNHNLLRSVLIRQEILKKDWHLISTRWHDTDCFLWDGCRRLESAEADLCPRSVTIRKPCQRASFENSHQDTFLKCSTARLISVPKPRFYRCSRLACQPRPLSLLPNSSKIIC